MALKMPQLLLPAWQCGSEPWASAGSSGFPVTSVKVKWKLLRRVWLFATPRTVACYTPLSWSSPGKNTGVGCRSLLQGIFPTQGMNPHLPHCRQILYHLSHQGSPKHPKVQTKEKLREYSLSLPAAPIVPSGHINQSGKNWWCLMYWGQIWRQ